MLPYYPYPYGPIRNLVYPYTPHVTDTWDGPLDAADYQRLQLKLRRARKKQVVDSVIAAVENDPKLSPSEKEKAIARLKKDTSQ